VKEKYYDPVPGTVTILTTFALIGTTFLYTLNFYILLLLVPAYVIFIKYYGSPVLNRHDKFMFLILINVFTFAITIIAVVIIVPIVKTQKSYNVKVVRLLKDKLIYDVNNTTEVKKISELEFYKLNYCLSENKHLELVTYNFKRWAIKTSESRIQCKK